MPETERITNLMDFGMGFMAALRLKGHHTLDERRLVDVHKGVVEAFQVVEAGIGRDSLGFRLVTDRFYGTSPVIDSIFNYWLSSGFATKDAPGTIYRFDLSEQSARTILDELDGGHELYDKAIEAYLSYMATHFSQ